MSPAEVTSLVTTVGFGPLAAYFMWVFTKSRIETAEKAAEAREAAAMVREVKLVERINHLEDNIRSELVSVVIDAKSVMADCSGTLKACTVAMQNLKCTNPNQSTHT